MIYSDILTKDRQTAAGIRSTVESHLQHMERMVVSLAIQSSRDMRYYGNSQNDWNENAYNNAFDNNKCMNYYPETEALQMACETLPDHEKRQGLQHRHEFIREFKEYVIFRGIMEGNNTVNDIYKHQGFLVNGIWKIEMQLYGFFCSFFILVFICCFPLIFNV